MKIIKIILSFFTTIMFLASISITFSENDYSYFILGLFFGFLTFLLLKPKNKIIKNSNLLKISSIYIGILSLISLFGFCFQHIETYIRMTIFFGIISFLLLKLNKKNIKNSNFQKNIITEDNSIDIKKTDEQPNDTLPVIELQYENNNSINTNNENISIIQNKSENNTLSTNQLDKFIPLDVFELLWFINGPYKNIDNNINKKTFSNNFINIYIDFLPSEPSAIDFSLPIDDSIDYNEIGYYPSYDKLTPFQRLTYLNWLKDVDKEIDISYVFIFFYGLERFLFTDKVDKAVEMIVRLQKIHKNNSFISYSNDAIIIASLINKKFDWILKLDPDSLSPSILATFKGIVTQNFDSNDIMFFSKEVGWTNNRYIKNYPDLFLNKIDDVLKEKYNDTYYKFTKDFFKNINSYITLGLSNYSLNPESRFAKMPNILSNPQIASDLFEINKEAHEKVKKHLKEERKNIKK